MVFINAIVHVSDMTSFLQQIEQELKRLVTSSAHSRLLHKPYVTTKHGQLRSHAGSTTGGMASAHDLAKLETLTEVRLKV